MEAMPNNAPAPITWYYVAGFFDGQGSAGVYDSKKFDRALERETLGARIVFSNTDAACLEAIRAFMSAGKIYRARGGNVPCYSLVVYRVADLRRIIPELLRRCRIKGPALTKVLAHIEDKAAVPTYGVLSRQRPRPSRGR
jgi:hypothetical protein